MLSKEEIKASDSIAHRIVSDCMLYGTKNASICIKERVSGLSYILEIGKYLPKSHPISKQSHIISDIIDSIKHETFIIVAPD